MKHQHLRAEKEEQAEDRSRVLSGKRTVESYSGSKGKGFKKQIIQGSQVKEV